MQNKTYPGTPVLCSDEFPAFSGTAMATFDIDEQTARKIVALSVFVRQNDFYKVEKFDYRVDYTEDGKSMNTECDTLNVSGESFWFSAFVKHSSCEIYTEKFSVAQLAVDFGIPSPDATNGEATPADAAKYAEKPVRIVIEMDGGLVQSVRADADVECVLVDYDVSDGDSHPTVRNLPEEDGTVTKAAIRFEEVQCSDESDATIDKMFKAALDD